MRITFLILFSLLLLTEPNAQDIKSDTTLAGKYLSRAKNLIYNRQFNKLDSILLYCQQSARLFNKSNNSRGLLESLCLEMQVFARRNNEKQTILLFDSIADLSRKEFGEKNVYLANALHNLGVVNQNLLKYDPALESFLKSAEMRKGISGTKNLELAQTYMNLGLVSESKLDYVKALEYYNNSLTIRKELLGEKDFNVAQTLYNIGNNYRLKGDPNKALEFMEKALEIRRDLFGEVSADVAFSFNGIGLVYERMREYEKALEYYSKALEVRLALPVEPNMDLAQSYTNVAIISATRGDYDKALDCQFKSMEIKKKLLGPESLRVAENYLNIGNLYRSKAEFPSGLEYYLKALEIRLKILGPKHVDVAKCYGNLGLIFMDLSDYNKALEYHLKSLNIFREVLGEKHINLATVYNFLGSVYKSLSDFDKSFDYYTKSLEMRKEYFGENSLEVADSYYNLATAYNLKSDFVKDLELNMKALSIYRKLLGENSLKVADSYNNIGLLHSDLSEFDVAIGFLNKSLSIKLSVLGEMHTSVADTYYNLGSLSSKKSDYDNALRYYQKAISIRKNLLEEISSGVAESYHKMGELYKFLSEYDKSLEYYQKALLIKLKLFDENHLSVANSYNGIGEVYCLKTEFDKGLEYFFKALEIFKNVLGEKNSSVASSYNNIGAAYDSKGEFEKALSYHSRSLEMNRELFGEGSVAVANNYNSIGIVYSSLSDGGKYLEYMQKSSGLYRELLGEQSSDIALVYNNMGVYYSNEGDNEKALEYHLRSLGIRQKLFGKKHIEIIQSYSNIANIYGNEGDYSRAIEYFQKGLCANVIGFDDTTHLVLLPKIDEYLDHQFLMEALFQKGQIFEILADSSIRIDKPGIKNLTKVELYKLSLQNFILCDQVIDKARKNISLLTDKMALGDFSSQIYEAAIKVSIKMIESGKKNGSNPYLDIAFNFSEKNKSMVLLEAMAGQEGLKFAGIPDSLLEREHFLKVNIAFFEKQLARPSDKKDETNFRNLLFAAKREHENLTLMFEKKFPKYYNLKYATSLPSIKVIQSLLDEKTAIRSYFEGYSTLFIFTVSRDNLSVCQLPLLENVTDSTIWYRYGLTNTAPRMQSAYKRIGRLFYQYLFPDSLSIPKNITNLIIIPDGTMATIPFETLLTSDYEGPIDDYKKYPYLINRYNISYSYSANLLYRTFSKTASQPVEFTRMNDWLALAPVFDDKPAAGSVITTRVLQEELHKFQTDTIMVSRGMFNGEYITPLPGTETETEEILKLYDNRNLKGSILLHNNANEEFVKTGGLENSKILHFATHGFVNSERPDLSGILLAPDTTGGQDGILYSGEIYNLKLNSDLVLLSACETGLGKIQKGEGIIGLTRALLYAGVRNIIVSLWMVGDQSTSDLMVDFYRNSLNTEQNLSYSESLRKAKMLMIQQGKYSHPLYWSPFILIGK